VDVPHPVHRLADAAAGPVEGRHAHVPGSLLPLAICTPIGRKRREEEDAVTAKIWLLLADRCWVGSRIKKSLGEMTWRRGAAHAPVVDVLDLEPDQPRAERDVLVGEPVQDRPGDRAPASTSGTEGKGEHDARLRFELTG